MFRFANAARIHMNTTRRYIAHMHDPITASLKPKHRIPKGTGVNVSDEEAQRKIYVYHYKQSARLFSYLNHTFFCICLNRIW